MRIARLVLIVVLALAPLGARAQDAPLPTLHVGAGLDVESTPIIYAQQAGLFRAAGLNVTIDKIPGGGAAIAAAVVGGTLQIGKSSSFSVISAHARGVPFVLLAPAATYSADSPDLAMVVAANSPIRSARDLDGRTIGVISLATSMLLASRVWMDANGGDSSTVRFVEIGPTAAAAAVEQGRIDATVLTEPSFTAAMHGGKVRVLAYPYNAIAHRFALADYFATASWVADHRELATKFAQVMLKANAYVAAHESELVPLIASYVGIDPTVLAAVKNPERGTTYNPALLQPLIDDAARYKMIPAPFPAADLISDAALKAPK